MVLKESEFEKGIQVTAVAESWSKQALKDGKVSLKEAIELATRFCEILNIPLQLKGGKGKKKED